MSIAAVIPLFNGARFIDAALQSVFLQSLRLDEIIVVDDGSTDNGPNIVAALARRHRITLLHKPNGGQSSARNWGVAHASSDVIAFLDQDDIWYPTHVEQLSRPFQGNDRLGWVYSNPDEIDEGGNITIHALHHRWGSKHPKADYVECIRADMGIIPTAALVRRAAINAVGGFDERLSGYEDDDLFLRILRAGYAHVYISTPTGQWRKHPSSSSHSPRMARSLRIYADKLLHEFPDYRDMIAGRFSARLRRQLYEAIRARDEELSRNLRSEAAYLLAQMSYRARPRAYAAHLARIARGYIDRVDQR
jgi:glycosyltransferase involved in cell wall biosynthesis